MSESDNLVEDGPVPSVENHISSEENPAIDQEETRTPEVLLQTGPNGTSAALPASVNDTQANVNSSQRRPDFEKGPRNGYGYYPQERESPTYAHGHPPYAGDMGFHPFMFNPTLRHPPPLPALGHPSQVPNYQQQSMPPPWMDQALIGQIPPWMMQQQQMMYDYNSQFVYPVTRGQSKGRWTQEEKDNARTRRGSNAMGTPDPVDPNLHVYSTPHSSPPLHEQTKPVIVFNTSAGAGEQTNPVPVSFAGRDPHPESRTTQNHTPVEATMYVAGAGNPGGDPGNDGSDDEDNGNGNNDPRRNPDRDRPDENRGNDRSSNDDENNNPISRSESHDRGQQRETYVYPNSIMSVKSIEMSLTELTKAQIQDFQYKSQIACLDHPHLNPAIWISKLVLNRLLEQANDDIMESAKLPNGTPNYAQLVRLTSKQLYDKIGVRSEDRQTLIGVAYIVKIMTRCIADTKHLFVDCLGEFNKIDCRGNTATHVRNMHKLVNRIYEHWTTSMEYTIGEQLSKDVIKGLNSRIQGKLFDSNFYRTFMSNKADCKIQMRESGSHTNADNDITLWLAVLNHTLSTFEEQMEFAAGPGAPKKSSGGSSTRNTEGKLANIQAVKDKDSKKKTGKAVTPTTNEKHMTCFQCGKKGVKTGHEDCKQQDEPNAAGIKAKAAYREKILEKKKNKPRLQAIESDSESESEEGDMCMLVAWDNDTTDDSSDDDDMPGLVGLVEPKIRNHSTPTPVLTSDNDDITSDDDDVPELVAVAQRNWDPSIPVRTPGVNKLQIFQDVVINSAEATVMFDTGALGTNGNWISKDTANRLGAFLEKTKKKSWKSPLFPDATYVSQTKTSLSILFKNFGFEIQHIEFRVMESSALKADIILGLEFIEQYDIMNYLIDPQNYRAVEAPLPADEEALEWDEGILAFQSAILDLSGREKKDIVEEDHDYRTGVNVDPNFPRYERACKILEAYHGKVLTKNLHESTINCPPMNIKPINPWLGCKPRRMNEHKKAFLDKWLDKKLKAGIIEPCSGNATNTSMPTSPLVLVAKPSPASDPYRITLDAKEVNKCFPAIQIESPITRECMQRLGGKKYYWKADMLDYFFQFEVSSAMADMYAFSTHRGIFRFKLKLPQGDRNSQAWTTNSMGHILIPLDDEVTHYVDDFSGGDDDPDILCDKLERFLQLMLEANAKFSPSKIFVGFPSVDFVGFVVSAQGYKPKENQLQKFATAPFPTREKLRSWFGLLNVFRDFIPNLQEIDVAFSAVRKKNAPWIVTEDMEKAFKEARKAVSKISFLTFPENGRDLFLDADASDKGCGAILYHLADDKVTKVPIRFMSHVFTETAVKWSTIEKECWALVKAFNTFEFFLFGREFTVKTDHRNLLYMQRSCNAKVQRWFGYLMLFDFTIEHIPGIKNIVADALSRVLAFMAQLSPTDDGHEEAKAEAQALETALEILQQEPVNATWTRETLQELFNRFHNGVTGHLSLANTLVAMKREKCGAPHLKQHVIRMMARCAPCEKARQVRIKPKLEYHSTSGFKPFDTVQADFLTGIGKSDKGFSCILVFTCTFTRYTMLYPCVDQTAPSVANNLLHLWGVFGSIRQLTSDGASCFTSKLVCDVCKLLRVKQFITSAYNPGSHGIVENRNREITKIARKVYLDIADASDKNWEVYLPVVQRILNAQSNVSTGFSPYHLIFGTMVTQDLKALESPAFDIATIKDPDKFIRDLDNTLNIVVQSGLTSIEDQVIRNYLTQSDSKVTFKEGDFVLLPNHRSRAQALGKFAPQLIGPMKVVKNFNNDFYELRDLVQDEPIFAHGCDLRIFNCESDQQAIEIAALDYNELTIHSVQSHFGNPDKLGQLKFVVTFSDDLDATTTLPYKEVKFVQIVRDYIIKNKNILGTAAADLRKQETIQVTKRVKRISSALKGYEH